MSWTRYFGDRQMHRSIWMLAWPMLLSNITVPLVGLVDSAVVGHLEDPSHLGAVAIGATLFTSVYWAFGFLRMGTTGLVARACGRQDDDQNRTLLAQGVVLALVIGAGLVLLQYPIIHTGLYLMGPEAAVLQQAEAYSSIRIFGAPAALLSYVFIGWFVGNQNTRVPLYLLTLINLINLLLDLLFVLVFNWGAAGVAAATLVAEYSGLLLAIFLVRRRLRELGGQLHIDTLQRWSSYASIIRVNRYLFVRTLALLFMFAFFTAQGARIGTEVLAANALLLNFLMLISHALDGFAHATEAACGRYAGANRRTEFYTAIGSATLWSLLFTLLLTALFGFAGQQILRLMSDIEAVLLIADQFLVWIWLLPIIAVWSYLLDGILVGTTQVRAMQQIILSSVLLVFLPLWWLLQPWGNAGLWSAFLCAFIARGGVGAWYFRRFSRNATWFGG